MKILHTVEFYHPSVGGMQEVVKQLSERLVGLGHDVSIATTKLNERSENVINGVKIIEFDVYGNAVRGLSGNIEEYRKFLIESSFDVITNFAAQQWATDVTFSVLDKLDAKKVLVPTGFPGLNSPLYNDYFTSMKNWMRKYDACIFLSDNYRDINFARENNIVNTVLIPNGAGEDEFLNVNSTDIKKKLHIPAKDFLILHVGSHTGVKGHSEAIEIFSRADIRDATFLIMGNYVPNGCMDKCQKMEQQLNQSKSFKSKNKRIIVSSLTREETVEAYIHADLFLFPSNIECSPIVLFECMASKTPFLVTDVGNSAEIIEWSKAGLLLPTRITYTDPVNTYSVDKIKKIIKRILSQLKLYKLPVVENFALSYAEVEQSVQILNNIYNDTKKRNLMAEAGFSSWQKNFSWEKIVLKYEKLYLSLLKGEKK